MRQAWLILILINSLAVRADDCRQLPQDHSSKLNGLNPLILKVQSKKRVSLNVFNLKSWTNFASLPCKGAFTATYVQQGKKITFLAMDQITVPTDPFTNKELKKLEKTIGEIKPTGVLTETSTIGFMTDAEVETLQKKCYKGPKFLCDIASYTALLAHENGALIKGGEAPPHILHPAVLIRISNKDLLFYKAAQSFLLLKRQSVPAAQWEQSFDSIMNPDGANSDSTSGMVIDEIQKPIVTFELFKEALQEHTNTTPEQLTEKSLETFDVNQANTLQRATYAVDHTREPFILKNAEQLINRSDNVVIVYSPKHYYIQQNVLKDAFHEHPPIIKCLD
jgi:hypothetical protein